MYPSSQKPYAGIFVLNQYNHLKQLKGLNVDLFTMKRTFTNVVGSLFKYFSLAIKFIPKYFKHYDIIHLHYFFPLIILASIYKRFNKKTKLVVTFHGSDIKAKMNNKLVRKVFKFFARDIDFAIAVGKDLSNDIETRLGIKVNAIISAGVDKNTFYPIPKTEKLYDYIFVGSFIHRKGVDIVINAIKTVNDNDISFCFVGSGPYANALKELSNSHNIHIFENQTQEELRQLYNASKFFLFPSRDEPFGLVATEALYCGTPIIVSKVGGLKEQVKERINGFFATTQDEVERTILQLKDCDELTYKELKNEAIKSNKVFSLEHICSQLHEIYHTLAKQ